MWDTVLYGLFPRTHTETNVNGTWRTINVVKDTVWSARTLLVFQSKELTPTECCRLTHRNVQDYVLRDTLKLGAAATEAQKWSVRSILETLQQKERVNPIARFPVQTVKVI
eukprot:g22397.t1